MDSSKPISLSAPKDFFTTELTSVLQSQQLIVQKNSFEYLVNLMVKYIESDKFFVQTEGGKLEENVLTHLYTAYLHGEVEQKKILLQRLGDVSLIITGFFSDSLNRKLVDLDYYFGMGGTAYLTLANYVLHSETKTLYRELATKFKQVSSAISELSEKGGLQNNQDVLRLYEKWLVTGSEHLKTLLSQHGIAAPVKMDSKVKH